MSSYDGAHSSVREGDVLRPTACSMGVDILFQVLGSIVHKEGYMSKQGGSWKTWKRRFFVLRGNFITYYESEGEASPKGVINLDGCEIEICKSSKWGKEFCFEIHHSERRSFVLHANSEQHRNAWAEAISEGIRYTSLAPRLKQLFDEQSNKLKFLDSEFNKAVEKQDELRDKANRLQRLVDDNKATVGLFNLKMEEKDNQIKNLQQQIADLKLQNKSFDTSNEPSVDKVVDTTISLKADHRIQNLEDEKTTLIQKVKELTEKYNKKRAERELLRKEVIRLRQMLDLKTQE